MDSSSAARTAGSRPSRAARSASAGTRGWACSTPSNASASSPRAAKPRVRTAEMMSRTFSSASAMVPDCARGTAARSPARDRLLAAQVHGAEVDGGGNRGHGAVRSKWSPVHFTCLPVRLTGQPRAALPSGSGFGKRLFRKTARAIGGGPEGEDRVGPQREGDAGAGRGVRPGPHQLAGEHTRSPGDEGTGGRRQRRPGGPSGLRARPVLRAGQRARRRCSRRAGTDRPAPGPGAARSRCCVPAGEGRVAGEQVQADGRQQPPEQPHRDAGGRDDRAAHRQCASRCRVGGPGTVPRGSRRLRACWARAVDCWLCHATNR